LVGAGFVEFGVESVFSVEGVLVREDPERLGLGCPEYFGICLSDWFGIRFALAVLVLVAVERS
jgi:hypothetical protein